MNKRYTFKDGKVIVYDECMNKKEVSNRDNIGDVLAHENYMELMGNKMKDLIVYKNNIINLDKESKRYVFLNKYSAIGTSLILGINLPSFINTSHYTELGEGAFVFLVSLIVTLPVSSLVSKKIYSSKKERKKIYRGYVLALNFLKEELEQEKDKLAVLYSDKTNSKKVREDVKYSVSTICSQSKLDKLVDLYLDLGYSEKELYKSYKKDTLVSSLGNTYSGEEIQLVREYFSNKEKKYQK